jgi:hypothetical protein
MNVGKLYRGVSVSVDSENGGKVLAKGTEREVTMKIGDKGVKIDGKFQIGPTVNNTARAHQLDSGMHGGCGISTTRSFEEAKKFATSGGVEDGYVYEIDENLLSEHEIEAFEFPNPEYPHEEEVTLIPKNCDELPSEVITGKQEVKSAYGT